MRPVIATIRTRSGAAVATSTGGPQRVGIVAFGTKMATRSRHARSVGSGRSNGWPVALAMSQPCTTSSVRVILPHVSLDRRRPGPRRQGRGAKQQWRRRHLRPRGRPSPRHQRPSYSHQPLRRSLGLLAGCPRPRPPPRPRHRTPSRWSQTHRCRIGGATPAGPPEANHADA